MCGVLRLVPCAVWRVLSPKHEHGSLDTFCVAVVCPPIITGSVPRTNLVLSKLCSDPELIIIIRRDALCFNERRMGWRGYSVLCTTTIYINQNPYVSFLSKNIQNIPNQHNYKIQQQPKTTHTPTH